MTATLPQALREPLGDTGLTYRQISHWCKRGWLHPVGEGGSGNPLEWPARVRVVENS